ncbi:MAG: tyrosine-type recombinase/integrase [Candidatus Izemoplasmatales bacterium]
MAKIATPLSDTKLRNTKPTDKITKLSDGKGLYFIVLPNGTKFFRFDYSFGNKRKSISLGTYPQISLSDARAKREEARGLLAKGYDPSDVKKNQSKVKSELFEHIANEWIDTVGKKGWKSADTYKNTKAAFQTHIYPLIGSKSIKDITRKDIIDCITMMEKRGLTDSARKTFNFINRIFKYTVTHAIIEHNIIADIDVNVAFTLKNTPTHHPAITDEREVPQLLVAIDTYGLNFKSDISTIYLLKIMPYLFLRPSEIKNATWQELDFKNRILEIPAERMKTKKPHIVPLPEQVIKLLEEIKPYSLYKSQFIFPSPRSKDRPLSENTINNALKNLGYKDTMVGHGFRAMASTLLHEKIQLHGFESDIIECQLSHTEPNKVKAAYNRDSKYKYFEERKALMQWWADYLDKLKLTVIQ